MSARIFDHLIIFMLAVCALLGRPPAARADGPPQIVLVENTDVTQRLNYPVLISQDRGYRIRCASQSDEEDIIRGLGFLSTPSTVLDAALDLVTAAAPLDNPLLCPNGATYAIRAFHHTDQNGDKFYLQFPEALGAATYTNKIYVPGCKQLFDALKIDPANVAEADPGPFFANATFEIACKAGDPLVQPPKTFAGWCARADLGPEQVKTVEAMLKATPEGEAGRGNAAACQRAETFLKALPSVDLSGFELTDVGPVGSLANLTMLDLSNNKLTDIGGLSGLSSLSFLDLGKNQIDNISALGALAKISDLDLGGNRISNLRPLSSLAALQKLDLSHNQITDIGPLSRLVALTQLRLAGNQLTGASIETITGLSALTFLDLSDNRVETLEHVGELPSTVQIQLDGNPVVASQSTSFADTCVLHRTDATPFGFTIRAMVEASAKSTCQEAADALASKATLELKEKGLSDIRPLALLGNLRSLDLSANSIVDVGPLRPLSDLRQLKLATNNIRDVTPLADLVNLDTIDFSANPVDVSTYLPACLMRGQAGALTADQLAEVTALLAASQKTTCLASQQQLERVVSLRVANAQLKTLDYFPVLKNVAALELPGNELTSVSALATLPALARLDLSQNQVATLQSFSRLTQLTGLILAKNPLNSLNNIQLLANLKSLDISDTAIRVVRTLNTLPALEEARLRNLNIEYLGYEDYCLVDKYDSLALGPARAFVLAVAAVASAQGVDTANCQTYGDWAAGLQILNLNKRDLTNIDPLRLFGSLKELYLYDNRIQDISPIVNLGGLETVSLATNQITGVPRLQSRNIRTLNLNDNRVGNVSPLSDLQSLQSLDLMGNVITDASPLRALGQISALDLRNNRIAFISGLAHWTLPKTYISGNPICDFPHESSEVVQACKRRPLLVILDHLHDFEVSPHVILDAGHLILSPRSGRFENLAVQPDP